MILMASLASILFLLEYFLPMQLPFMRLGLANILTVLALIWWGEKEALFVVLMRIVIGGILSGRLFSPVFFLAIGGSLTSLGVMSVIYRFGKRYFSIVGISLWGAIAKNITQLFLIGLFYIQNLKVFALLPVFIFSTLISGIITGLISFWIYERMLGWNFSESS